MNYLFFLISLFSSTIGAISGIGGGVIIKPVLDATGTLSVSTISWLSGCTVLSMSAVSLLRGRKSGVSLEVRSSTALAIGAALGGIAMGSTSKTTTVFDYTEQGFDNAHYAYFTDYFDKYVGEILDGEEDTLSIMPAGE